MPPRQHAGCVLMSLRYLSGMQQHAGCVLSRVGMQEASPLPETSVINGGRR
ncbi:hypothetical protein HN51_010158, partial [Arachis hypogaea]